MEKIVYDIDKIFKEIKKCLKNKLYLAALHLALSIPDVCGHIELPKCDNVKHRYSYWVNKYCSRYFVGINFISSKVGTWGHVIFNLRNAVLHNFNEYEVEDKSYTFFKIDKFILFIKEKDNFSINPIKVNSQSYTGTFALGTHKQIEVNYFYLIYLLMVTAEKFIEDKNLKAKDLPTFTINKYDGTEDECADIVLAIKPKYAEMILNGSKFFELRKKVPTKNINKIYLYASHPISKVIGEVDVFDIITLPREDLWKVVKMGCGINKKEFDEYFLKSKICNAYQVINPIRYTQAKTLSEFGIARAPMDYAYKKVI